MSLTSVDPSQKVRPQHLDRAAHVYVRQSSYYQVEHNLESQRRQYDLRLRAVELGWPAERVVVVDEDQGKSSRDPGTRDGFTSMATAVGRSEVGLVLSLEASRLARNNPEWHHLIYLCRWTDTLIGDELGIYNPADANDRLLLGIRGQMSELALETDIRRMVEARWNKARRGEFLIYPPAGYEVDEFGQLVLTSDLAVQDAIRTVFTKFDELGTARQVFVWWRDSQRQLPVRRAQLRGHPVVWVPPRYRGVLEVLHNPIYAGAYVFGRTKQVREIDPDDPRKIKVRRKQVPMQEWPVLIRDHHPAYISYEQYLENRERIHGNIVMRPQGDETSNGPAREGEALLQGLVRCGHCGRRMLVAYGGGRPGRTWRVSQYRCGAARRSQGMTDCQLVGGKQIDKVVVEAFLEAVAPAGVEAALLADEQLRQEGEALQRYWELQVERAEYEAQRAQRQYDAVEPENRVVARELERRWNERLEALEAVRVQSVEALRRQRPLTEAEVERASRLGTDLEAVWEAETTTNRDRKRLLRCAIEEVQLRKEEDHYHVRIVWTGGQVTNHQAVRHRAGKWNVTPEDTVELVRKLAAELDDAQIARVLNKQGRRTGSGKPFTKPAVGRVRRTHDIPAAPKPPARDPREGPFTADEAAAELGVNNSTIHRWLREGVLPGRQLTSGAPWRIVLTEELRQRLSGGDAPAGWVGLSEAARRLGLSKQRVAYMVKRGKLPAMRTKVGKRTVWRIDVSSTDCGKQDDLF